jgi:peptidyl-prolyl cis-trans isomerase-like protein 2
LSKPLSDHVKVVAIIQPGGNVAHVYSHEAYRELNVKPKCYEDLLTGVKFNKDRDVIVLNDPDDDDLNRRRDINTFYHIVHARDSKQQRPGGPAASAGHVQHSTTGARILEQLRQKQKADREEEDRKKGLRGNMAGAHPSVAESGLEGGGGGDADEAETAFPPSWWSKVLSSDVTGVSRTTGQTATSLTSTSMAVSSDGAARVATLDEILSSQFNVMKHRLKGRTGRVILRLQGRGDMTLELRCDVAPRACANFLGLCARGAYDGTRFHRLISGFMIQGGKASGQRKAASSSEADGASRHRAEDRSLWGGDFADEFDDRLRHDGPGVLAMANSGRDTNRQQFYITFQSCHHLDRKHTIFGRVVDGMDVLQTLESIETDEKDRPVEDVVIAGTMVLANPAQEAEDLERDRLLKLIQARERASRPLHPRGRPLAAATADERQGQRSTPPPLLDVGRYLQARPAGGGVAAAAATSRATSGAATARDASGTKGNGGLREAVVSSSGALGRAAPSKGMKFGDFSAW